MFYFIFRRIYQNWQIVKFVISGGTAAVVDLVLLYVLTDILGIWYLISATLAFVAAFFVSFGLQKYWTFGDRYTQKIYQQLGLYLTVAVINMLINAAGMYYLVDKLGIWYILAQVIVYSILAIESFLVYKYLIFKNALTVLAEEKNHQHKVLIATGIYPPDFRGPATLLEALPNALRQKGWLVKIITYSDIKGTRPEKEKEGVWRILRHRPNWFSYLKYFWRLWELARWASVIYVTDVYSVGYFVYLMRKIAGKKYVVRFAGDSAWEIATAHGLTNDYIIDFQKKNYSRRIEKLKARRAKILLAADKIIAVSNFMADVAKLIGAAEDKIKVIYNAVDFVGEPQIDFKAVENIKNQYGGSVKIIVSSGQLVRWKGMDGVIKILPELQREIGKVNLLILGEGQELANLKNLVCKLNLENSVYFLGKIKRSQILNYFKAADLFILNSNYEGLSHTLLEVMKAGAPIVTTNIGGNPEVIENSQSGLLIEYNNQEQLLGAAEKILSDSELARKLVANAAEQLKNFSWGKTVESTAEILRNV